MEIKVLNFKGEEVGRTKLPEIIFSSKADPHFLHEVVKYYLAAKRVGTVSTKTKAEVSGGGRKPWKQKHTGRARAGSIRSPLWRKGGVVFGPKPRDFSLDIPEHKKIRALAQSLAAKSNDSQIFAFENFDIELAKTKFFYSLLKKLNLVGKKLVLINDKQDDKLMLATRNIPGINVVRAMDVNAYDVLNNNAVFVTLEALKILEKRLEEK